jgi:hypothetical protein
MTIVIPTDRRRRVASAYPGRLVNHGVSVTPPGYYGVDFRLEWKAPDGCECIITNPPLLAKEFAAHALMLCPRVVMLLRLAFLESERRRENLEGVASRAFTCSAVDSP